MSLWVTSVNINACFGFIMYYYFVLTSVYYTILLRENKGTQIKYFEM